MTKLKIFVPENAYHHVFEPLSEGIKVVNSSEPDVELAVLGMQHAPELPAFIDALPGLQAVLSLNAGVDWLLPYLPESVAVYNASGVHDAAVSEWVVAVLLAMRRRLPDMLELKRRGEWDMNLNDVTATGPSSIGPIDTFEGENRGDSWLRFDWAGSRRPACAFRHSRGRNCPSPAAGY